jgi:hypothetical protein
MPRDEMSLPKIRPAEILVSPIGVLGFSPAGSEKGRYCISVPLANRSISCMGPHSICGRISHPWNGWMFGSIQCLPDVSFVKIMLNFLYVSQKEMYSIKGTFTFSQLKMRKNYRSRGTCMSFVLHRMSAYDREVYQVWKLTSEEQSQRFR